MNNENITLFIQLRAITQEMAQEAEGLGREGVYSDSTDWVGRMGCQGNTGWGSYSSLSGPIIHSLTHTHTQFQVGLVQKSAGVKDAALPILWACPGMPAPAPTGPLHTGQSDFPPRREDMGTEG